MLKARKSSLSFTLGFEKISTSLPEAEKKKQLLTQHTLDPYVR